MNINIISIGRFRNNPQKAIFEDYLKRSEWNISLKELEIKNGRFNNQELKQKEGELIIKSLAENTISILLDEKGQSLSSRNFANLINKYRGTGRSLSFIIAGANGASEDLKKCAQVILSLGKMTFPHMMVRTILAEQIYRANSIINNHPYHRD